MFCDAEWRDALPGWVHAAAAREMPIRVAAFPAYLLSLPPLYLSRFLSAAPTLLCNPVAAPLSAVCACPVLFLAFLPLSLPLLTHTHTLTLT